MGLFDDRENALENKYFHDAELKFKAVARRNKLLGLWAADKMKLAAGAAETYAKDVIKADFEEVGDDDVIRKVLADLSERHIQTSQDEIKAKLEEFLREAIRQLEDEA